MNEGMVENESYKIDVHFRVNYGLTLCCMSSFFVGFWDIA